MIRAFNPKSIAKPQANYIHGIEVPANARLLFISGQLGVRPDGTLAPTIEEQAEVAWNNIAAILADANMGLGDIVKFTSYLTKAENLGGYHAGRNKVLGKHAPTSTLLVISQLARPEFLVEVEAFAAKV
jgi:2-iminobutanoate/2-iminopropanoate deaminase